MQQHRWNSKTLCLGKDDLYKAIYVVYSKFHLYQLLQQADSSVGLIYHLPTVYDKLAIPAFFWFSEVSKYLPP